MSHSIFARAACAVAFFVVFSTCTVAAQTQPPPPNDPAEGGGAGGDPVRVGPVTFSGGTWVESIVSAGDEPTLPVGTFRIRRARIGMAGNVTPKIGWSIAGELSGSPALRVAFVLFRLSPQFNVRMGQATPPSGLERGSSPLMSELIERSRPTLQLTHTLDMGITIQNAEPYRGWLSYALSAVNGTGFTTTDNNAAKDVVARLRVTPPALAGVTVVASAATGKQPVGQRTRASVGAQYDIPVFKIAAEVMRQVVGENRASEGLVVSGAWRIRPAQPTPHFRMLELGARVWVLVDPANGAPPPVDEDGGPPPVSSLLPETTREVHAGVNYDVNRNFRLMGNVIVPVDDRQSAVIFLTRLQVVF